VTAARLLAELTPLRRTTTVSPNAHSGEVEAVIYEHAAVREATVFGIADRQWGGLVMECVVLRPGSALDADELIAYYRRSLAKYKVPRRVDFLEPELPKFGSGKIRKRTLRERYWVELRRSVN